MIGAQSYVSFVDKCNTILYWVQTQYRDRQRKEGRETAKHLPLAAVQSVTGKICRRDREYFTKRQR